MSDVTLLVVDDDEGIRDSLSRELRAAGFNTITANEGHSGLVAVRLNLPNLVLTDLAMPGADGFELIAAVRRFSDVPIVVLSVREADSEKVRALDLGADDFVTKPFSVSELLARVRAQLRRSSGTAGRVMRFGDLTIDLEQRKVREGDREIRLTPLEFSLLELLARHAGKPLLMQQIIARVWSDAPATTADTVRVHMSALRRKLEPDPSNPRYVVTEPWVGYRFIREPE